MIRYRELLNENADLIPNIDIWYYAFSSKKISDVIDNAREFKNDLLCFENKSQVFIKIRQVEKYYFFEYWDDEYEYVAMKDLLSNSIQEEIPDWLK